MISGILFVIFRSIELFMLIPLIGMLSSLVHGYVSRNLLTPNYILVLFIVSVLAGVWALFTLLFYRSARRSGHFLSFVDLGIFAALIAGVVVLRGIAGASCSDPTSFSGYYELAPFINDWTKTCSILKACFAFAIINILLFLLTFFLAIWVHHHYRRKHPETTRVVERRHSHSSRHDHRKSGSRSGSRGGSQSQGYRYDDRDRRRSGGGASRYSSRRSYV